jgi:nucleoporin GLE1
MQLEFNLLLSRSDRDFNDRLDQAAAERAKITDEQLAKAAQEHLRIQEGAKLELQRILLEEEQQKQRREEEQRKEIERLKLEKAKQEAEAQRQRLEEKRKEEELARQTAEHQKQIQEADARAKAQQQQAAQRRKDAQAQAAAAAQEKAQTPAQTQAPPTAPVAATLPATTVAPAVTARALAPTAAPAPDVEELHRKYMELHARMKKFRTTFYDEASQPGHPLKGVVGDARRTLRTKLGQISTDRKTTQRSIKEIREKCLDLAKQPGGPMIDIRPFIISRHVQFNTEAEAQYPAFLLYLWIQFGKFVVAQWKSEATSDGAILQEVGLLAASLYADKNYMVNGVAPVTDLLLAKLHRKCPMLFGISGNTTSKEGLIRLGLDKYEGGSQENEYAESIMGIGAGYASIHLRQYKSTVPAFDMADYWRAVVGIINTPSDALYPGHFLVLKGLLHDFVHKFLGYYGAPAKAVVRRAVTTFPARAPLTRYGVRAAAEVVSVLPGTWKKGGVDIDAA